jgi:hypothetical protein
MTIIGLDMHASVLLRLLTHRDCHFESWNISRSGISYEIAFENVGVLIVVGIYREIHTPSSAKNQIVDSSTRGKTHAAKNTGSTVPQSVSRGLTRPLYL